jgi:hypothetical protein
MKPLMVVCVALLLWASSANAKDIAGMIQAGLVSDTPGACDVDYSYCPSGNCECAKFAGDVSGGQIGRGSVDLFVTIDRGAQLSPAGTPSCYPFFASAQITAARDQATMNIVGASCASAPGTSKVTGGFGINATEVTGLGWGGLGSVSGSMNRSTGVAVVHYIGKQAGVSAGSLPGFGFGF